MADRDQNGRFQKGHAFRFQPGASGNPGGRPRDFLISDALRQELLETDDSSINVAVAIAKGLVRMALYDNNSAIRLAASREIVDRMEGKPRQAIEVGTENWREAAQREGLSNAELIAALNELIDELAREDDTREGAPEAFKN